MYRKLVRGLAFFMIAAAIAGLFYFMTYLNAHDGKYKGTLVFNYQNEETQQNFIHTFHTDENEELV